MDIYNANSWVVLVWTGLYGLRRRDDKQPSADVILGLIMCE